MKTELSVAQYCNFSNSHSSNNESVLSMFYSRVPKCSVPLCAPFHFVCILTCVFSVIVSIIMRLSFWTMEREKKFSVVFLARLPKWAALQGSGSAGSLWAPWSCQCPLAHAQTLTTPTLQMPVRLHSLHRLLDSRRNLACLCFSDKAKVFKGRIIGNQ